MISLDKKRWFDDYVGEMDSADTVVRDTFREEWGIMLGAPSRAKLFSNQRDPDIYNEYSMLPWFMWYNLDRHYDPSDPVDMLIMRTKKTRARYTMACRDPGPVPENVRPYVTERPTQEYLRSHGSAPVYSNLDLARDGKPNAEIIEFPDSENPFLSDGEFNFYLQYQDCKRLYNPETDGIPLRGSEVLAGAIENLFGGTGMNEFAQRAQTGFSWLKEAAQSGMQRAQQSEQLQNVRNAAAERLNRSQTFANLRSRFGGKPAPTCPGCGARLVSGARFCSACGRNLAEPQKEAPKENIPEEFEEFF